MGVISIMQRENNSLIGFAVDELSKIGNKKLFATDGEFIKSTIKHSMKKTELESNHEEADSRIISHTKEILMKFLVAFLNFTGCDAISAFPGTGKVKPLS